MLKNISASDKNLFVELSEEFYRSPAVLHKIPVRNHSATFDELINGGGVYLDGFFVFHEGELAGYCLVGKGFSPECGGKVVWIEEIYLREPFRSKGIGRSLFAEIFKRYGAAKRFRLEVEPSNARAAALYTSLGFKKLNYVQYIFEPKEN